MPDLRNPPLNMVSSDLLRFLENWLSLYRPASRQISHPSRIHLAFISVAPRMDLACISPNLVRISAGRPLISPKCFSPRQGYFKRHKCHKRQPVRNMGGTRWPAVAKRSRLELTRDSSRWLQIAPHKKLHFPDGVEQELAEITERLGNNILPWTPPSSDFRRRLAMAGQVGAAGRRGNWRKPGRGVAPCVWEP